MVADVNGYWLRSLETSSYVISPQYPVNARQYSLGCWPRSINVALSLAANLRFSAMHMQHRNHRLQERQPLALWDKAV